MPLKPEDFTGQTISSEAVEQICKLIELCQKFTLYAADVFNSAFDRSAEVDTDGLISHEFRIRCTSQYLLCRRSYGDDFLAVYFNLLLPMFDKIAESCHRNPGALGMAFALQIVVMSLVSTKECPELGAIFKKLGDCIDEAVDDNVALHGS